MRVYFTFTDNAKSDFEIQAEVNPVDHNRIQIVDIRGEGDIELSMEDFSVEEQRDILWQAKSEAEELDKMEMDDDYTEEGDDELESDY